MAVQYVVTAEELQSLIDRLELVKLRKEGHFRGMSNDEIAKLDDMHRSFHFEVVRWVQEMGYRGHRS